MYIESYDNAHVHNFSTLSKWILTNLIQKVLDCTYDVLGMIIFGVKGQGHRIKDRVKFYHSAAWCT